MSLNININKDDFNLNDYLFVFDSFKSRPNKILLYESYLPAEFIEIITSLSGDNQTKTLLREIIPSDDDYVTNDKVFLQISETIFISYVHVNQDSDAHLVGEVTIYYKGASDMKILDQLIEKLSEISATISDTANICKTNTLSVNGGQLELESIEIKDPNEDDNFESYYHPETFKGTKKLIKLINKSNRGISILWGERGTGKTSMLKHILFQIEKMSIFMPNNMVDTTVNNPDFKNFVKRHPNLVIVIDDCEIFFNEAYTKSNMFTSNILQLVEGFLSETLNLQFILSFNIEDDSDIDHTLIDSNNLIDIVEFQYLDEKGSKELISNLNIKHKVHGDSKLIDILKKKLDPKPYPIGLE